MMTRALLTILLLAVPAAGWASGLDVTRAQKLPDLEIHGLKGFSQTHYEVETGKLYRWEIEGADKMRVTFEAPELWRNATVQAITIEDISIEPLTDFGTITFTDDDEIEIYFTVNTPGTYDFYVDGMQTKGMQGSLVAK